LCRFNKEAAAIQNKDKTILYGESPDGETVRFYGQTGILLGEFKSAELAGVLRLGPWQRWAAIQRNNLWKSHTKSPKGSWERRCENWASCFRQRREGSVHQQALGHASARSRKTAAKINGWEDAMAFANRSLIAKVSRSRQGVWGLWAETVSHNSNKRNDNAIAKRRQSNEEKSSSVA